jgi:hypothetical protein
MPIEGSAIVIPEKVLNKFWVHSFIVGTEGVNGKAWLRSSLLPHNDSGEIGQEIVLDEIDVFEAVQLDPDADQIFGLVMAYVEKKAKEQDKI